MVNVCVYVCVCVSVRKDELYFPFSVAVSLREKGKIVREKARAEKMC